MGPMEVYESLSRALMRRKYRRIDSGSGFAVRRRRVKVAHLGGDDAAKQRTALHRLRLRCFRLRFLVPGRFLASLKTACVKVMHQVASNKGKPIDQAPQPILFLPKTMQLRSSNNDVINEAWFQQALRRSIAEGRLQI